MTVEELRRDYPEVDNGLKTFVVRTVLYNVDNDEHSNSTF
jgi:hypothetical protein